MSRSTAPRLAPRGRLIRPIEESLGPVTRVAELSEHFSVEELLRAADAGVPFYDANGALMADYSAVSLVAEDRRSAMETV
jgi:hypothetical protein